MDFQFERMRNYVEACLQESEVFERPEVSGQWFESTVIKHHGQKWLVLAAGVSESESESWFPEEHARRRSRSPLQVCPSGRASLLLIMRPTPPTALDASGRYFTEFATDVKFIELLTGCYFRVDELDRTSVRQIRWELDAVNGHRPPQESWLRTWAKVVGCNPAHAPSHWHINSPTLERSGPRQRGRPIEPPELRLATGLPNPLLLILSVASWLRKADYS